MATFSQCQTESLLGVMNGSAEGHRDVVMVLTLLDTGLRVNELISLKMDNVWLEEGLIKVLGKGNKERLMPIGKQILPRRRSYQLTKQKIGDYNREDKERPCLGWNVCRSEAF